VLQGLQPHVAGIQEAWGCQVRYLQRRLPGSGRAGVGRGNGSWRGEHCAVLYRPDRLALERQVTRWLSDTPHIAGSTSWGHRQPRVVTMAWFRDRTDDTAFGVANAHFDDGSAEVRVRSVASLVTWIRAEGHDRPWIVLGDLNATPDEASFQALLAAGWRDALAALAPRGDDAGTAHQFSGRRDGERIDHILVEDPWRVVDAAIVHDRPGGRLGSDHWPVQARVTLS
jgi:endonuclease/exonuclease/phosphatase family metal-dependent hydrolase